ncbi:potassium-transporting ATPase subunit KdpC [Euzebya tangerina]|uniref:potassium-transporting ATPase subunit KdpC n=1 Tax=Euzebya tangerina TaxID=591198 RepID=UPI000E3124CA|nr:potassium-transporting ATPase subunit KdpC [Euzebya tangerina]
MRPQLLPALRALLLLSLLTGLLYPLAITGIAQAGLEGAADGSLVTDADGQLVGAIWVGQAFTRPEYFTSRPSAVDHDGATTGGSSLGPTNEDLLADIRQRVIEYRQANDLADDQAVPVDAVTASGSGWDPHISPANARLQAPRVADVRGEDLATILAVVEEHTERPPAIAGEEVVNVLALNLALDAQA